jgi:hypothetical protein
MYLLQTIYPFALASVNMAMGWLLYSLFESVFGGLLVVIGLLIVLALVGSIISQHTAMLKKSA